MRLKNRAHARKKERDITHPFRPLGETLTGRISRRSSPFIAVRILSRVFYIFNDFHVQHNKYKKAFGSTTYASDKNVFDIGIGIRLGAKEEVGVGHGNNGWHR